MTNREVEAMMAGLNIKALMPFQMDEYIRQLVIQRATLLANFKAITPHAWGHSTPGCKGKARDPENCDVCKSIWAARDAIAAAEGRAP